MFLSTRKKITSVLALGLSVVLLFGGTFAWQSLNQEALNEIRGGTNPGGRLHDDFNNVSFDTDKNGVAKYKTKTYDKDVYVENFTSALDDGVQIFARVRLDEYMEIGPGAGTNRADKQVEVLGLSVDGTPSQLNRRSTWTTRRPGDTNSAFQKYWIWTMNGGQTTYMPTFNKNKDSLAADINGTFGAAFADYVDYTQLDNVVKEGWAIYDNDNNDDDELQDADLSAIIAGTQDITAYKDYIRTSKETHAVAETIKGTVITMDEWLDPNGKDQEIGSYWVWDDDGWAYWAAPILPQTATGLLLDQVARTDVIIESTEWYYGINVVAQFITADSLGSADNHSGFFDTSKGSAPTNEAMMLLSAIGVDTSGENQAAPISKLNEVKDASELRLALESGSEQITLTNDIELDEPLVVEENTHLYLNGRSITPGVEFNGRALFTVRSSACLDFDGQGLVQAPADGYAAWVEDNGLLYIWDGTFIGGAGAVYVSSGEAVIVDGTFYLQSSEGQLLDWRAGAGKITVFSGTFYNFDPSNVYGENLLEDGYAVEAEAYGGSMIYTVTTAPQEPQPEETPAQPNEELPMQGESGEAAEGGQPADGTEAGDTQTDGSTGEETGGETGNASGDVPPAPEPSTPGASDSSVIESTGNGTLSGISGKADVVEPEAPEDDIPADNTAAGGTGVEAP